MRLRDAGVPAADVVTYESPAAAEGHLRRLDGRRVNVAVGLVSTEDAPGLLLSVTSGRLGFPVLPPDAPTTAETMREVHDPDELVFVFEVAGATFTIAEAACDAVVSSRDHQAWAFRVGPALIHLTTEGT